MSNKQLIEGQRYQIESYLRDGFSYQAIGNRLKVSHSTISREVWRNKIRGTHQLPKVAQSETVKRRLSATKYRVSALTIVFVEFGLNEKWSPEQMSGVGKHSGHPVRHEWIYGCVQRDKFSEGKLYKQLRYGRCKYRKSSRATRVIIPNHVGKEHRPAVVDRKRRFGDWEADTVLGKNGTGAIVSLIDRKSKFCLIRKVPAKRKSVVQ